MYEVTVNDLDPISINFDQDVLVGGETSGMEIVRVGERSFQVIHKGGSYTVHVLDFNPEKKEAVLRVNGKKATIAVTTELDRLLKSMGLENAAISKVNELKAPMPGLIHSISVEVGQDVAKGDALLILEAMKMENVIKSPTDGTIGKIHINKGESVEKSQILISFV